ncbi:sensor histidine kinase [Alkalicoccobacillus murimartini]|uniref:Two-component system LytT family sensor kinase n=1 Tax=Alkalicoccobacillus murimartini TaxID=171685 RepID=A0ABT9YH12_9BACI|nr:sensor histidine kinase [Alkalicoccobacillus murimartini]MDQ0206893.1 two-component system LytT family sensor kinase [Alkalicoccobacillus murimartini]
MNTYLEMFIHLLERAALLLICLYFLTKIPGFREILQKDKLTSKRELSVVTVVFCAFALFGTYSGIEVEGSLVNVRTIAIVAGGILFGPWVGVITGVISGIHRYVIDIGGVTAIPCLITSITAGVMAGIVHFKVKKENWWTVGIAVGMFCEIVTMGLILLLAEPVELGMEIVSIIAVPMILGEVSIGLIILMVLKIEGEKERVAATQSKMALEIANKTLPYFRSINQDSLHTICEIIKVDIEADAVAITDTHNVLAYVGFGEERYSAGSKINSELTKQSIRSGEITIRNQVADHHTPQIQCLLIIPFKEHNEITGSLKIYYQKADKITDSLQTMAIGLAQIISTLMEISRIEQIRAGAEKAELKALQATINPHFLFNALNAIASTTRTDPVHARELIINLSGYLRYNLEVTNERIEISQAIEQVQDYVEIEKARFGDKLKVYYEIDPVDVRIPSLLIQPLVENAINHGVQKGKQNGAVTIRVEDRDETVRITVKDTGVGISQSIIDQLYSDQVSSKSIGLTNVHQRVKLIYGEGLVIRRLDPGTEIYFDVAKRTDER